ncbi:MAG: universal stress protein [Saprospiraceae bacterium]|nr:universal stress protein [Saprospiraceae bacterium]
MKNILVLIDFEDPTEHVAAYAMNLADAFRSHCWLLHVASPDPEFVGYEPGPQYIRDHRAGELKKEHIALENLKAQFLEKDIPCEILLIQGYPAKVIQAEVEKRGIDLLVMGHHRRIKLREWIVGSVGKEVLRDSTVPLLIIPVESAS